VDAGRALRFFFELVFGRGRPQKISACSFVPLSGVDLSIGAVLFRVESGCLSVSRCSGPSGNVAGLCWHDTIEFSRDKCGGAHASAGRCLSRDPILVRKGRRTGGRRSAPGAAPIARPECPRIRVHLRRGERAAPTAVRPRSAAVEPPGLWTDRLSAGEHFQSRFARQHGVASGVRHLCPAGKVCLLCRWTGTVRRVRSRWRSVLSVAVIGIATRCRRRLGEAIKRRGICAHLAVGPFCQHPRPKTGWAFSLEAKSFFLFGYHNTRWRTTLERGRCSRLRRAGQ